MVESNPVFQSLSADDVDPTVTEIESCCMNCYKNVSSKRNFGQHFVQMKICILNARRFGTGYNPDAVNKNPFL